MRFSVDQRFPGLAADAVAHAFAGPDLFADYPAGDRLAAPEVVAHAAHGDRAELQLRFRFTGDLSSAVRAVVDPGKLSWVERSSHDLSARTATWALLPDHYADRLRCSGTVRVVPDGDGCRRIVEGDLKVRAPLVAGTIERTLVADLQDHLRAEVAVVQRHLDGSGD